MNAGAGSMSDEPADDAADNGPADDDPKPVDNDVEHQEPVRISPAFDSPTPPSKFDDPTDGSPARAPTAVLFCCTMNSIRSPMAESMLKFLHGDRIYVDSVGVHSTEIDGYAITVMDEIGIDLARHNAKTFDDMEDDYFDLVISLSPEAQHKAVEMTRWMSCEVEFWNTFDPSIIESEKRETKLDAFRQVRDQLMERLKERFPRRTSQDT